MLGWLNPFPLRLNAASVVRDVYQAYREALGEGGAGPAGGLDDLELRVHARAIAAAGGALRRAMWQRWPATMGGGFLSIWEKHLGLSTAKTAPERAAAVTLGIANDLDATFPGLQKGLTAIDAAFVLLQPDVTTGARVMFGRAWGPLPGAAGTTYGPNRQSTGWAAYNDRLVVRAQYVLPAGLTQPPQASLDAAAAFLCELLPGHYDFELFVLGGGPEGPGFYLDGGVDGTSLLDSTAFA